MMTHSSRATVIRRLPLFVGLPVLCLSMPLRAGAQDALDRRLERIVVPLRSLAPADEDFSDLEPLVSAIGSARIVQLGEASHGAGASFEARARLIKFLHQRMGFDVVVWESNLFSTTRFVNDAMRAQSDPSAAAQQGIFPIWSMTREARPVFEYAQRSWSTSHPLEMSGFDDQFSTANGERRFDTALVRFTGVIADRALRADAMRLASATMERFRRFDAVLEGSREERRRLTDAGVAVEDVQKQVTKWTTDNAARLEPGPADLQSFLRAVDSLVSLIRVNRTSFVAVHASREIDLFLRALSNLRVFGADKYENSHAKTASDRRTRNALWNVRDRENATNMLWLAREYYAGRKLIVWGHNGHLMNAHYAADWSKLSHTPSKGGMTPTGAYLKDSLGNAVFTIALTAHSGTDGLVFSSQATTIGPPPIESLEHRFGRLRHDYAFLDVRAMRRRGEGAMLRGVSLRLRGYDAETMPDWTRVIDGVVYMREARRATRLTSDGR